AALKASPGGEAGLEPDAGAGERARMVDPARPDEPVAAMDTWPEAEVRRKGSAVGLHGGTELGDGRLGPGPGMQAEVVAARLQGTRLGRRDQLEVLRLEVGGEGRAIAVAGADGQVQVFRSHRIAIAIDQRGGRRGLRKAPEPRERPRRREPLDHAHEQGALHVSLRYVAQRRIELAEEEIVGAE